MLYITTDRFTSNAARYVVKFQGIYYSRDGTGGNADIILPGGSDADV